MPDSDYIFQAFDDYAQTHPWVKAGDLRPKSVARDMFSRYCTFNQYVRDLGLERIEGALLRHLSQTGQLAAYTHQGFWQCMDNIREMEILNELWASGQAPWKTW